MRSSKEVTSSALRLACPSRTARRSAERRSPSIMLSLKTWRADDIAPISSPRPVQGMSVAKSRSARRRMAPVICTSGREMSRIRAIATMVPISITTAMPTTMSHRDLL